MTVPQGETAELIGTKECGCRWFGTRVEPCIFHVRALVRPGQMYEGPPLHPKVVRIHAFVMEDLLEYSTSMPSGVYAGKRWKRKIQGTNRWMLGEYIDDGVTDGTLLTRWTPIEVIPKKTG